MTIVSRLRAYQGASLSNFLMLRISKNSKILFPLQSLFNILHEVISATKHSPAD